MNFWSNFVPHHDQEQAPPPRRLNRNLSNGLLALVAVSSLTSVIGNRFYNQPQLAVDTIAPKTITAQTDGAFEDKKTTEIKRQEIRQGAIKSLMRDPALTAEIRQQLEAFFVEVNDIRTLAGDFPFLDEAILSLASQTALRQSSPEQWEAITAIASEIEQSSPPPLENLLDSLPPEDNSLIAPVRELYSFRTRANSEELQAAIATIQKARDGYQQAINAAESSFNNDLFQVHQTFLLKLSEADWLKIQAEALQAGDRILTQGIPQGLAPAMLQETIQAQLTSEIARRPFAVDLLSQTLEPNLIEDPEETKRRSEQAALAIEPVMVTIDAGEIIVNKGETIDQSTFVLLDGFGLSNRQINWWGLGGYTLMVSVATGIVILITRQYKSKMRQMDWLVLLLISLSTPILALTKFPYGNNLPAVGLLTSSLYHPQIALTQVTLLSGITVISDDDIRWDYLFAATLGGIVAAYRSGKMRSREEQATLGFTVGAVQTVASLAWNLIASSSPGTLWFLLLKEAALFGLSGTVWIIIALGLSPYLEKFFELLTPIRLAELSNLNRPLLTLLAHETPGTFQHTLFVASLAEAAGRKLDCNVELIRAGTLYHDIGKTHDPEGFIENQEGGPNKHDSLDPYESAEIIRKHVTEGIKMAKKHHLPKPIRDFIPEHQGTMKIAFFYHRACTLAEDAGASADTVDESFFRYEGPIPQSRETGIVMLADSCEAALRSLKDATPDQAAIMVNRIFRARWQDGQLAESGIAKNELPSIVDVFVKVWEQYNHKRIAYPKAALESR